MNRRDIFKNAAGAAAAVTVARGDAMRQANGPGLMPGPPRDWPSGSKSPVDLISNADFLGKQALMTRANEEANAQSAALQRRRSALLRMRSVSDAYREYQMYVVEKEQTVIWSRLEEARRFIFG